MVTEIQFIISVCFACCLAQGAESTRKRFDHVQAAVFSRVAYPEPGTIPVLNRKVFRGKRVTIEEHPYVASVRRLHAHYLTGAVLTLHVVASVAHPIHNVPLDELNVVTEQCYNDRGFGERDVLLVVIHEDFDPYTLLADLALIRIHPPLIRKTHMKPIALYREPTSYGVFKRASNVKKAWVTGWGRCDWIGNEMCLPRSTIYSPDEKQDPMLKTISFDHNNLNESPYCVGYKNNHIELGKGMLCIGTAREEEPLAPCLAVPGAPLTVRGRLVGLQSWGFGCGYTDDLPLIYTDFRYYHDWLSDSLDILGNLSSEDLHQLHVATQDYIVRSWLEISSGRLPEPALHHKPSDLQPTSLDYKLIQLKGNVTDFRDYIYSGVLSKAKTAMYVSLREELRNRQKLIDIAKNLRTPPPKPFLALNKFLTPKIST